ncbi:MAG: hypothetical protein HFG39_03985 [Lachnospiraceae bacterium]|nr:hypothetical protein [Lachnospiraceae bacterium]
MNIVFKIFFSMSFSGGVLILVLLLGKGFLKDKVSRQWQYYIWLVVILRLLFPFGSEVSLLGRVYQAADQVITHVVPLPQEPPMLNTLEDKFVPAVEMELGDENVNRLDDVIIAYSFQDVGVLLMNYIWLVWLVVALGLLIRKITIYQGFIWYMNAGLSPVSDIKILDQLSIVMGQLGIKKPIELCVNPLVSSPLLIGFFHPCIVLPSTNISEKDFLYITLHELIHYKRRDMFFKWLVQITACLHWFNPLAHLMVREITKACEFSCDEAVLIKIGCDSAKDYGKTLLDAMAMVGKYKENLGAVTLNENKQLLKERLGAIMNFKRKPKVIQLLTGILTLCLIFGAFFVGVYPTAAASNQLPSNSLVSGDKNSTQKETSAYNKDYVSQAERYYKADSLPLFKIVFSQLDEEEQGKWLDRIYKDQKIAFMGDVVNLLDEDCSQIQRLAKTAYKDGDIAFFSVLAMRMSEDTLKYWLGQALEDEDWVFQSILFNKLNQDNKFNELQEKQEKEWEAAHIEKYRAAGITIDGKNYYYQGKLVHIFLDIRQTNKSFYTLDINPKGTINIKIVRNENNEIAGVAYMTEEEVIELFDDKNDPDNEHNIETIPINVETIAAGETIYLGEYTLSEGDKIYYDIFAETGNGMKVFFTKDGQNDTSYWSVHNLRQQEEPLKCTTNITVDSTKEGNYQLFLKATDNTLKNIKGTIIIQLQ